MYFLHLNVIFITYSVLPLASTLPDPKSCGIIKETPEDLRTFEPWSASIFIRTPLDPVLEFLVAGTILNPSLILTVVQNKNVSSSQTSVFKKTQYKFPLPKPKYLIVGAALKNAYKNERDTHTQFREVSYVEPYPGVHPEKKLFNLVLIHLKVPLDVSSQYTRSLCVPINPSSQNEFMVGRSVFREYFKALLEGNTYFLDVSPQGIFQSSTSSLNLNTNEDCGEAFENYYNRKLPVGVYCIRNTNNKNGDTTCLKQGQPIATKIFGLLWFSLGMVALIPQNQLISCNERTIYYGYVPTFEEIKWLRRQMSCKIDHFACGIGKCIPMERVCDGKNDCHPLGLDEDKMLCTIDNVFRKTNAYENDIHSSEFKFFNGINSTTKQSFNSTTMRAITKELASTEGITVGKYSTTQKYKSTFKSAKENQLDTVTCIGLPKIPGIRMDCRHPETLKPIKCSERTPARTTVTLSCEPFFKSKFSYNNVQIMCQSTGKWRISRPFSCEQECGIIPSEDDEETVNGNGKESFKVAPWHGALYRITGKFVYFLCGVTLIEKSFLMTAAHCLNSHKDTPNKMDLLKVVLSPDSMNYTASLRQNSKVYDIKEVWWPLSYDSSSLESDIAIIQLHSQVKFTKHVFPACIFPVSQELEPKSTTTFGTVAGFGTKDGGSLLVPLKLAYFEQIDEYECQRFLGSHDPTTICAAHTGGSQLCRGDSGGGLVFRETYKNGTRYILKGVVSHRVKSEYVCDMRGPIVFTQVSDFKDWIVEVIKLASSTATRLYV